MLEPGWMPTKTATQNHKLEDGPQEDNYLIQMPWTHRLGEPGEDSPDQKKSITTRPCICHEEGLYKEEEEEGILAKT